MKILQINTIDVKGGAAKVAFRLKQGLKNYGHDSKMIAGKKYSSGPDIKEVANSRIFSSLNYRLKLNDFIFKTGSKLKTENYFKETEIVNYHNLHGGYFNILSLPELTKLKPSVWTLHDPWIIQDKDETPEYDAIFKKSNAIFNRLKANAINKSKLTFVTPSLWLKEKIKKYYPEKEIRVIPNGIDINIFKPRNKVEARKKLNLPLDKNILLFVAHGGESNIQKGGPNFELLKNKLDQNKNKIIALGSGKYYIESEEKLALYYSAADIFIFPSQAENFPLTILEAMACATPAIAFSTGGVPEIIDHLNNGYLANYKDFNDFFNGVSLLLNNAELRTKCALESTKKIRNDFNLDIMIKNYIDLYNKILEYGRN